MYVSTGWFGMLSGVTVTLPLADRRRNAYTPEPYTVWVYDA